MNNEVKWINARQVYGRYGIPRNLLRELARDGQVGVRDVKLSPSGKTMKLYDSGDCKRFVG